MGEEQFYFGLDKRNSVSRLRNLIEVPVTIEQFSMSSLSLLLTEGRQDVDWITDERGREKETDISKFKTKNNSTEQFDEGKRKIQSQHKQREEESNTFKNISGVNSVESS